MAWVFIPIQKQKDNCLFLRSSFIICSDQVSTFGCKAFIEQQLVLHLRYGRAINGSWVRDNRIEVEFLICCSIPEELYLHMLFISFLSISFIVFLFTVKLLQKNTTVESGFNSPYSNTSLMCSEVDLLSWNNSSGLTDTVYQVYSVVVVYAHFNFAVVESWCIGCLRVWSTANPLHPLPRTLQSLTVFRGSVSSIRA